MNKIGYVIKSNKFFSIVVVPYHYFNYKYSKIQIKQNKYYIVDYRKEYTKGDIICFNVLKNKIYKILK